MADVRENAEVRIGFDETGTIAGGPDVHEIVRTATAFGISAQEALNSGEEAEVFNAALTFATTNHLSVVAMARVLLMVRPKLSRSALRMWAHDAPQALRESQPVHADRGVPDWFLNSELQLHSATLSTGDWKYSTIAAELTTAFCQLNAHFFGGQLPPAPISFDPTSAATLGSYRLDRDGLALNHRINLNARYVESNSTLRHAVLLHEMIHLWEHVVHGREVGGSYHTRRFCSCASDLGIPTNSNGYYLGIRPHSPFVTWLMERGIDPASELICEGPAEAKPSASPQDPRRRHAEQRRSHLARWTCGCERKVWVSAGQDLKAHCCVCDQLFKRT